MLKITSAVVSGTVTTARPLKASWKAAWTREPGMRSEKNTYLVKPRTMWPSDSQLSKTVLRWKSLPAKHHVWMAPWELPVSVR